MTTKGKLALRVTVELLDEGGKVVGTMTETRERGSHPLYADGEPLLVLLTNLMELQVHPVLEAALAEASEE